MSSNRGPIQVLPSLLFFITPCSIIDIQLLRPIGRGGLFVVVIVLVGNGNDPHVSRDRQVIKTYRSALTNRCSPFSDGVIDATGKLSRNRCFFRRDKAHSADATHNISPIASLDDSAHGPHPLCPNTVVLQRRILIPNMGVMT